MSTNEKINNTIDEIKNVLEKHADKEDAKQSLTDLNALLDKRIEDKKDK